MEANNCWIDLYPDTDFRGTPLTLEGPEDFKDMKNLPGAKEDWTHKIKSFKTGSKGAVTLFHLSGNPLSTGPNHEEPTMTDPDGVERIKLSNG